MIHIIHLFVRVSSTFFVSCKIFLHDYNERMQISEFLRIMGLTNAQAAMLVGVNPNTICNWRQTPPKSWAPQLLVAKCAMLADSPTKILACQEFAASCGALSLVKRILNENESH